MTDVNDLIQRMHADRSKHPWNVLNDAIELWYEAADALEAISAEKDALEKELRDVALERTRMSCYFKALANMEAELAESRKENEEQARLLGMGSEREARLMAEIADERNLSFKQAEQANRIMAQKDRELAEERKRFADAFPPHDCVEAEAKFNAAREVAAENLSLFKFGQTLEESVFGLDSFLPDVDDAIQKRLDANPAEERTK